ncbi:mycothiol conjugate amidase Mca [Pseudoclavibacter sp. CFCC 14310]|uniref:mycothiol conjugate amidase Mca n=1 Tax=Pseudoclavibacter sp. CFCC 14310 TaxID=2615180 RepID=UPI001CE4B5B8|nr:mycothiol conjugate amidase Mca [Pseudoclavibacter sp. CFCC 14310]
MTLRLMAVHAHPDDESSKGAATFAHYVQAGASVTVVSCTGGESGSVLNPDLRRIAWAQRDIAGLRHTEMAAARDILGVDHIWLGYRDSGLPDPGETVPPLSFASLPIELTVQPLIRAIRRIRPHVLITYDENGGYPHPDHIRCHEVSVHALRAAADATVHPDLGPAWQVQKLYYDRIQNYQRFQAVHAAMAADISETCSSSSNGCEGGDGAVERTAEADERAAAAARVGEVAELFRERPLKVTTQVECGECFETRDAALRSHESQVAPDSPFFFLPNDLQRRVWPHEDYQLVDSRVPTAIPEHDLFAGVVDDGDGVVGAGAGAGAGSGSGATSDAAAGVDGAAGA